MIHRVGKVLWFERYARMSLIPHSTDADEGSVESVACEELQTGFGRRDFEDSSRCRLLETCGHFHLVGVAGNSEVVIVTVRDGPHLVDPLANPVRPREVERCPCDRRQLTQACDPLRIDCAEIAVSSVLRHRRPGRVSSDAADEARASR